MLQNLLSSSVDGCSIYLKASTDAAITSVVRISEHLNHEQEQTLMSQDAYMIGSCDLPA